jgi:hypothetical protein
MKNIRFEYSKKKTTQKTSSNIYLKGAAFPGYYVKYFSFDRFVSSSWKIKVFR